MAHKKLKKAFAISGIVVVVLLALLIIVPTFFQKQIVNLALKEANERLNAKFSLEDFRLTMFRTFPNPTVKLEKVCAELKGDFEGERETLVAKDLKEEFFLTNLRLEEGFSLENYEKRFGSSFLEDYKERLEKLKFDSLLVFDGNRVHCTDKGILLLDRVLLSLFK